MREPGADDPFLTHPPQPEAAAEEEVEEEEEEEEDYLGPDDGSDPPPVFFTPRPAFTPETPARREDPFTSGFDGTQPAGAGLRFEPRAGERRPDPFVQPYDYAPQASTDSYGMPPIMAHAAGRDRWYQLAVAVENEYGERAGLGMLPAAATDAHLVERNQGRGGTFWITPLDRNGHAIHPNSPPERLVIAPHHPAVEAFRARRAPNAAPVTGGAPGAAVQHDVVALFQNLFHQASQEKAQATNTVQERFNYVLDKMHEMQAERSQMAREQMEAVKDRESKTVDLVTTAINPVMQMMMGMIQMSQQQATQQLAAQQAAAAAAEQRQQQWFMQQMLLMQQQAERERAREQAFMDRMLSQDRTAAERNIAWMQTATESEKTRHAELYKEREASRTQLMQAMLSIQAQRDPAAQMKSLLGLDLRDILQEKIAGPKEDKNAWERLLEAGMAMLPALMSGGGEGDEGAEDGEDVPAGFVRLQNGQIVPALMTTQQPSLPQPPPQAIPNYDPNMPVEWAVPNIDPQYAAQALQQAAQQGLVPVFAPGNRIVDFAPAQPPAPAPAFQGQPNAEGVIIEGGSAYAPQGPATAPPGVFYVEGGAAGVQPLQPPPSAPQPAPQPAPPPQPAPEVPPTAMHLHPRVSEEAIGTFRAIVATLQTLPQAGWRFVLLMRIRQSEAAQAYLRVHTVREACTAADAPEAMTDLIVREVAAVKAGPMTPDIAEALAPIRAE